MSISSLSEPQSQKAPTASLTVQRIYIKDLSCESPHAPKIFQKTFESDLGIQLNVKAQPLAEPLYEVELHITIKLTTKEEEQPSPANHIKTLAQIEIVQAGIFSLEGFNSEQIAYYLNTTCPTILYPYASALVSDLAFRTLATPLYLPPVNFEALYLKSQSEKPIASASDSTH